MYAHEREKRKKTLPAPPPKKIMAVILVCFFLSFLGYTVDFYYVVAVIFFFNLFLIGRKLLYHIVANQPQLYTCNHPPEPLSLYPTPLGHHQGQAGLPVLHSNFSPAIVV